MPSHALIVGAGQIGRAAAGCFVATGWRVTVVNRGPAAPVPGATLRLLGDSGLAGATGGGVDLLLDTVAYDAADAARLLAVGGNVGAIVAVSSASVYADAAGRALDEARDTGFPELPVPIPVDHPTVSPGPPTYSTRKVAMERALLDGGHPSVTILRPCAIHGVGSRHPREWWVVKRLLDERPTIPLAHGGRTRFQTTAAARIAEVALAVAGRRGGRIVNVADADSPNALTIAETIVRHLGGAARIVPLSGPPRGSVGAHPWAVPLPFTLADGGGALGAPPPRPYAETVAPMLDWLATTPRDADWPTLFPQLAAYPFDLFDYAAEDALGSRSRSES